MHVLWVFIGDAAIYIMPDLNQEVIRLGEWKRNDSRQPTIGLIAVAKNGDGFAEMRAGIGNIHAANLTSSAKRSLSSAPLHLANTFLKRSKVASVTLIFQVGQNACSGGGP